MNALARLGLYAVAVIAVFAVAYLLGGLLVPESVVATWLERAADGPHAH